MICPDCGHDIKIHERYLLGKTFPEDPDKFVTRCMNFDCLMAGLAETRKCTVVEIKNDLVA